jgi:hypothetical protein
LSISGSGFTSGLQGDRSGDHPLLGRGRPLIGNHALEGSCRYNGRAIDRKAV